VTRTGCPRSEDRGPPQSDCKRLAGNGSARRIQHIHIAVNARREGGDRDILFFPIGIGVSCGSGTIHIVTGGVAMSENPEDKPGSPGQPPDAQPEAPKLGRRLFIFRAAAVLGGAAVVAFSASRQAEAQRTDRDPTDRGGKGKGVTDNDPTDRRGRGSDNDPTDRGGKGKGTGRVDRDPTDSRGRGKGVTDRDPNDSSGRGSDNDPTDVRGKGRGR
jgi:hypothetical protein